ncbi:hypothetical protein Tco_0132518 [Tanacetum coccineum]
MDNLHYAGVYRFSTSSYIALFLLGDWLLFFSLTGEHPSRMFSLCSAIYRGTPVMSTGFQANMSRLRLNRVIAEGCASDPETIVHSSGIILLLRSLPIIPLYGDGDLTTIKFIYVEVECSSSPIFTSSDICPIGHMISPLKPMRGVVAGTIWLFTSGRSLPKQCSYSIYEADPPSTYI